MQAANGEVFRCVESKPRWCSLPKWQVSISHNSTNTETKTTVRSKNVNGRQIIECENFH
jgi:hypothetical protein